MNENEEFELDQPELKSRAKAFANVLSKEDFEGFIRFVYNRDSWDGLTEHNLIKESLLMSYSEKYSSLEWDSLMLSIGVVRKKEPKEPEKISGVL